MSEISFQKHIEKLTELSIGKDADFATAFDYFFTHLAEDKTFIKKGKLIEEKLSLFQMLAEQLERVLKRKLIAVAMTLIDVSEEKIIHGTGNFLTGGYFILYYLKEVQTGIVAANIEDGTTHFCRLSTFVVS